MGVLFLLWSVSHIILTESWTVTSVSEFELCNSNTDDCQKRLSINMFISGGEDDGGTNRFKVSRARDGDGIRFFEPFYFYPWKDQVNVDYPLKYIRSAVDGAHEQQVLVTTNRDPRPTVGWKGAFFLSSLIYFLGEGSKWVSDNSRCNVMLDWDEEEMRSNEQYQEKKKNGEIFPTHNYSNFTCPPQEVPTQTNDGLSDLYSLTKVTEDGVRYIADSQGECCRCQMDNRGNVVPNQPAEGNYRNDLMTCASTTSWSESCHQLKLYTYMRKAPVSMEDSANLDVRGIQHTGVIEPINATDVFSISPGTYEFNTGFRVVYYQNGQVKEDTVELNNQRHINTQITEQAGAFTAILHGTLEGSVQPPTLTDFRLVAPSKHSTATRIDTDEKLVEKYEKMLFVLPDDVGPECNHVGLSYTSFLGHIRTAGEACSASGRGSCLQKQPIYLRQTDQKLVSQGGDPEWSLLYPGSRGDKVGARGFLPAKVVRETGAALITHNFQGQHKTKISAQIDSGEITFLPGEEAVSIEAIAFPPFKSGSATGSLTVSLLNVGSTRASVAVSITSICRLLSQHDVSRLQLEDRMQSQSGSGIIAGNEEAKAGVVADALVQSYMQVIGAVTCLDLGDVSTGGEVTTSVNPNDRRDVKLSLQRADSLEATEQAGTYTVEYVAVVRVVSATTNNVLDTDFQFGSSTGTKTSAGGQGGGYETDYETDIEVVTLPPLDLDALESQSRDGLFGELLKALEGVWDFLTDSWGWVIIVVVILGAAVACCVLKHSPVGMVAKKVVGGKKGKVNNSKVAHKTARALAGSYSPLIMGSTSSSNKGRHSRRDDDDEERRKKRKKKRDRTGDEDDRPARKSKKKSHRKREYDEVSQGGSERRSKREGHKRDRSRSGSRGGSRRSHRLEDIV